ncbi:hypothetical protein [Streptomyces collinus]
MRAAGRLVDGAGRITGAVLPGRGLDTAHPHGVQSVRQGISYLG